MERTLIAYLLGCLLGTGALVVEVVALGSPVRMGSLAAYSLCGGLLASATRALAELVWPGYGARGACLAALSGFSVLHLAYFVNVKLLPSEPYWTPSSLALDAGLATLVVFVAWRVMRSARAQELRLHFGRLAAAAGLATLGIGSGGVVLEMPSDEGGLRRPGIDGPNLLLAVIDSARRDHLGAYGHARATSPNLDRWAERARVYTEAFSASSWTVPSVQTLLWADGGPETLARRLAARGYAAGCFTDNPHLHSMSPVVSGFDRVERSVGRWRSLLRGTVLGETIERVDPGDDTRLADRAVRWAAAQTSPVFLYVHLMDGHTPYRHEPIDGRRRAGRHIDFPATGMAMTTEEAADIVARYEGGLRSADRAVGQLLDHMAAQGRPWLAVVTADHGESMGEEGRWFHGGSLSPELLAVPLVVAGSGIVPGRFSGVVGHEAIPQTLSRAAGAAQPRGTDLRAEDGPGWAAGGLPPRLLYRVEDGYKVVFDVEERRARLFHLGRDAGEQRDLSAAEPERTATLVQEVESRRLGDADLPVPEDQKERLKALGYTAPVAAERSGSR